MKHFVFFSDEKYNFLLENILFFKEKTMSAGDMFLALGANDFFDRLANGSKEEQERKKNEARQKAMREEWEAQRAIEASERNELAMAVKSYEDALNDPMWLGYMIKTDKPGYIRAMSKAKSTFRGMDPKDPFCGMRGENGEVNPDFVAVVEDFYFEVRRDVKKYDYQLAKYNYLRDALIERFEGDENVYTEEYARNEFSSSRADVFERLRNNELIWAYGTRTNVWNVVRQDTYASVVANGLSLEIYPIAS